MLTDASKILLTAVTSALFTGILAFSAQKILERWFSRNLEKFKMELQRSSFEYQARFNKLHEKRVEVIAETYKRLARAERSVRRLVPSIGLLDTDTPDTELRATLESISDFFYYFDEHRLYLPYTLRKKLDELYGTFFKATANFAGSWWHYKAGDNEKSENFEQILLETVDKIPSIRKDIEQDFNLMLGESAVEKAG